MVSRELTMTDKVGFHTRTAAAFGKLATQFTSDISVYREKSKRANGKSMLSLMSLGVKKGHVVTIEADGADAPEAIEALSQLVLKGFDDVTH